MSQTAHKTPDASTDTAWHDFLRGVKPLPNTPPPTAPAHIAPLIAPALPVAASTPPAPPPRRPSPPRRPLLAGEHDGLDSATERRLKRGQLPIEASLDLHGLTRHAAFDALQAFIAESQMRGLRCVCIITGKGADERGKRLGGEGGVLRQSLPLWLNEPDQRARIIGFFPARAREGGQGATLVLLRRRV